jgi:hypothetical protein
MTSLVSRSTLIQGEWTSSHVVSTARTRKSLPSRASIDPKKRASSMFASSVAGAAKFIPMPTIAEVSAAELKDSVGAIARLNPMAEPPSNDQTSRRFVCGVSV